MRAMLLLALLLVAPAQSQYKLDGQTLVVDGAVTFETGSAKVAADSDRALAVVAAYLKDKAYVSTLRVEVHTDNVGNADANLKLSEARALAVAKRLVELGADCKRLIAVGFGPDKPMADNSTPEGRAQNRRVMFVNAALRGKAIGGMSLDGGGKVAGDVCGK